MGNVVEVVMEQWVTRGALFCFSFFKMELLKHVCLFVCWQ